ncbi:hypothetical protein OEI98_000508 [Thermoanaerobacter sp. RKWS2]|nr:hypothetical protein OEI98_000508 [Thermoanaerobacter sp. RKWS2]
MDCRQGCIYKRPDGFRFRPCSDEVRSGKREKEDKIDLAVGIMLGGKVGDIVRKGEPIATIYANDEGKAEWALNEIKKYILLSDEPVERPTLIFE